MPNSVPAVGIFGFLRFPGAAGMTDAWVPSALAAAERGLERSQSRRLLPVVLCAAPKRFDDLARIVNASTGRPGFVFLGGSLMRHAFRLSVRSEIFPAGRT